MARSFSFSLLYRDITISILSGFISIVKEGLLRRVSCIGVDTDTSKSSHLHFLEHDFMQVVEAEKYVESLEH
jgi:hypothetical protein